MNPIKKFQLWFLNHLLPKKHRIREEDFDIQEEDSDQEREKGT